MAREQQAFAATPGRQGARVAFAVGGLLLSLALAIWAASALRLASLGAGWLPLSILLPLGAAAALGILLRRDLIVLVAIVVLVNLPFLTGVVWDLRDTTATYEMFHTIYGELRQSNQLLLWLPYGTFGQPAEYVTGFYSSGVDFLVLLLGRLLGLRNTWLLFCVARLGEQLVFLLGMFLLSRTLFRRRSTVFLVCLAAAGGLSWYWHSFFNLRLVYVFPLAILFLVWFFERRRPEFLWLSGLCCVFAGQGASYILCVWLFVLLIISSVLFFAHRSAWRWILSRSWSNVLALSLFVAMAGSFVYTSVTAVQGFTFTKANRDPQSGRVLLDDYLHHGGNPRLTRVVRDLLSGDTDVNQWDSNFYAGLLPLFFFAWGLARERTARFWGVASAAIGLQWLAFGGAFAALTYYLPFMSYYRWLPWVAPLARVLIILSAGFGFERFWNDTARMRLAAGIVVSALIAIDATGISSAQIYPLLALYAALSGLAACLSLLMVRFLVDAGDVDRTARWTRLALVVALGIDILGYQRAVRAKLPVLSPGNPRTTETFTAAKLEYRESRTVEPRTPRALRAMPLAPAGYPIAWQNFLQWDGCTLGGSEPDYVLMALSGIHRLLSLRSADDPALRQVIGCESPKLRLVYRAVYADNDQQAAELTKRGDDLARVAVIELPARAPQPPQPPAEEPSGGNVRVTSFSANHIDLIADVAEPTGAWLIYADGYHRGWRATVNAKQTPIAKAYLAFKAVRLSAGRNVVHLWFWDGLTSTLMYLLALWSLVADLLLLGWLVKVALEPATRRVG
jgi:hypothetical protein